MPFDLIGTPLAHSTIGRAFIAPAGATVYLGDYVLTDHDTVEFLRDINAARSGARRLVPPSAGCPHTHMHSVIAESTPQALKASGTLRARIVAALQEHPRGVALRLWMELIFRETLPSDVEGIFSVRARTRENPMSEEALESLGITVEAISKDLASGRIKGWLCPDDSKLVGFCNGDTATGEVLVLAVLPDYERKGIGSRLLAFVVDWLRTSGFDTIWLAASPDSSTRAHGFYRSLGWRPNGEIDENGDEILVLGPKEVAPS